MPPPADFSHEVRANGEVIVSHRGRPVTTLRRDAAAELLAELEGLAEAEVQQLLARVTGQYRRGNERTAKSHPRNR